MCTQRVSLSTSVYEYHFHLLMGFITATLVCLVLAMFRAENISAVRLSILDVLQPVATLAIVGAYCHYSRSTTLREIALLSAWVFVLFFVLPLPQYAAVRLGTSPHDQLMAQIDESIGVNVGAIVSWARAHPIDKRVPWTLLCGIDPLHVPCVRANDVHG